MVKKELLKKMKFKKEWSLAKVARANNCDYRTIKRYLELKKRNITKIPSKKINDDLQKRIEKIIRDDASISARSIGEIISDKGMPITLSDRQMRRRVARAKRLYSSK